MMMMKERQLILRAKLNSNAKYRNLFSLLVVGLSGEGWGLIGWNGWEEYEIGPKGEEDEDVDD